MAQNKCDRKERFWFADDLFWFEAMLDGPF